MDELVSQLEQEFEDLLCVSIWAQLTTFLRYTSGSLPDHGFL